MDLKLKSQCERRANRAADFPAFSGLRLGHIRGSLSEALGHIGRLQILEEYTKHDITHIDAMLTMYDWLIPARTTAAMSPADWLLLTLSTYLHDFGMLVTRNEFENRESTDFPSFREATVADEDPDFQDYRAQIGRLEEDDRERFLYQEFVRKHHASRVRNWLFDDPDPRMGFDLEVCGYLRGLFDGLDDTFRRDVGLVCESHHEDDLDDTEKYPLDRPYGTSSEETANVQYSALLVRTADLLHITRDRVPSVAAVVVSPRNPTSQREWAKQGAVRNVRAKAVPVPDGDEEPPEQDTVEVHAVFKQAEGFFGLASYLQYASEQLQQSYQWGFESERRFGLAYHFPWRKVDPSKIEAEGFEAKTFQFSLDQGKILDLLTGHTLYNDTGVVLRELVQNSLDAVRLQGHGKNEDYVPRISVSWNQDDRVLTVRDNGTGMTQAVIEKNFLRVGASRYQEADFKRDVPDFTPISRFGIGVLSAFMVADDVEVTTVHPDDAMARQMNLRDVHGRYLVRHIDKADPTVSEQLGAHGTSVTLKLRPSARLHDVRKLLEHWIVVPGCDVVFQSTGGDETLIGAASVGNALERLLIDAKLVRPHESGLVDRVGNPVLIRELSEDGFYLAYALVYSEYLREWNFLRVERQRNNQPQAITLGTCVGGIRVTDTTPGYRTSSIAALANAHGRRAPRTNVARSALERTDEFFGLMSWFYQAYAGHVTLEMDSIEKERNGSITYASREGSYIAEALASVNARPEARDELNAALHAIPAFVVEEGNRRTRGSMRQLAERDEYTTIESTAVADLERLLASVRGASHASLGTVLDALGVKDDLARPTRPLLCGLNSGLLISSLFRREWEIAAITSETSRRTLQVTWGKLDDTPRWSEGFDPQGLPRELLSTLDREASGRRQEQEFLISSPGVVEVNGVAESLVRCHGLVLVLDSHPLQRVELLDSNVPKNYRSWVISWLLMRLMDLGFGTFLTSLTFESTRASKVAGDFIDNLRQAGVFELVSEESVIEALRSVDMRVHDVARWDRRDDVSMGFF